MKKRMTKLNRQKLNAIKEGSLMLAVIDGYGSASHLINSKETVHSIELRTLLLLHHIIEDADRIGACWPGAGPYHLFAPKVFPFWQLYCSFQLPQYVSV